MLWAWTTCVKYSHLCNQIKASDLRVRLIALGAAGSD